MDSNFSLVCPTYVGMNRAESRKKRGMDCMPHVCGDEPGMCELVRDFFEYAPRMWG